MKLDYALFGRHTSEGTFLSVLLKGHLWLELSLEYALRTSLQRPDVLNIDRMMFAARVNLCDALGAFDDSTIRALRAINALRNRAAHSLEADLTESDWDKLESSLDGAVRVDFHRVDFEDGETVIDRLGVLIFVLLHRMQMTSLYREYERKYRVELVSFETRRMINSRRPNYDARTNDPKLRRHYNLPEPPGPWDAWHGCSTYDRAKAERSAELERIFGTSD